MKYCPYCGGSVEDDAVTCQFCGKGLVFTSPTPEQPAPIPEEPVETVSEQAVPVEQQPETPAPVDTSLESSLLEELKQSGVEVPPPVVEPAPEVLIPIAASVPVAAAVPAVKPVAEGMKRCPYCAEEIRAEATICRYCGKNVSAAVTHPPEKKSPEAIKKFEDAINRYRFSGYNLVSRMENFAMMERRAPIAAGLMVMWVLVFWIGAIIYASEGSRKKYTVQISQDKMGNVNIVGDTMDKVESDKTRTNTIGWIISGIILASILCVVIFALANQ